MVDPDLKRAVDRVATKRDMDFILARAFVLAFVVLVLGVWGLLTWT